MSRRLVGALLFIPLVGVSSAAAQRSSDACAITCLNDWSKAGFGEPGLEREGARVASQCRDASRINWDQLIADADRASRSLQDGLREPGSDRDGLRRMIARFEAWLRMARQEKQHVATARRECSSRNAPAAAPVPRTQPPVSSSGGNAAPVRVGNDSTPVVKEFTESATQRRQREEFERNRAVSGATGVRQSVLAGDWATAARRLDQALAPSSASPSSSIAGALSWGGLITDQGLQAFQQANNEYRSAHDWRIRLFGGSPDADRRYRTALDVLERARALFESLSMDTGGLASARFSLNDTRTAEASGRQDWVNTADEWRQAVLSSAVSLAIMAPIDVVLPARVAGEDDGTTIAFIRKAQSSCSGNRDVYCAAVYARAHKDDASEDPKLYPSRRNAEHYLFAKALSSDVRVGGLAGPLIGVPAVIVFTPAYSLVKHVLPGSRFSTSPPSQEELRWGRWGAVVALTGRLDPSK